MLAIYQALAEGSLGWEDLIADTQVHHRLPLVVSGSPRAAAAIPDLLPVPTRARRYTGGARLLSSAAHPHSNPSTRDN